MSPTAPEPRPADARGPAGRPTGPPTEEQLAALVTGSVRATLVEYLEACPICFGTDLVHYHRRPSLFNAGEHIVYERCRGCGVVLRNPRMPANLRLSIYEDKILPDSQKRLLPRNQLHYAYILRWIERLYPRDGPRSFFDFGCGAGGFLLEARKAGWEVEGLELNKDLARFVTDEYDVPVFQGLIGDPRFAGRRFGLVVSAQVFEHLLDPRQTLLELVAHLEPPGFVLIEVPNQLAIKERLQRGRTLDDSHLFYFSAAALRFLFEDTGFEVLHVQEGLRPYRLWPAVARWPQPLVETGIRSLAALGIRTGLSVLARLDP
ncbi:MAG: class I SAM-dependent methyltransferase [Holophagales bacterium]|nr:class I SAM-dependent methyltransferase [Holophagales bacterium]